MGLWSHFSCPGFSKMPGSHLFILVTERPSVPNAVLKSKIWPNLSSYRRGIKICVNKGTYDLGCRDEWSKTDTMLVCSTKYTLTALSDVAACLSSCNYYTVNITFKAGGGWAWYKNSEGFFFLKSGMSGWSFFFFLCLMPLCWLLHSVVVFAVVSSR